MQGFLPEDHWIRIRKNIKNTLGTGLFRTLYPQLYGAVGPEFQVVIEEIKAEVDMELKQ